MGPGCGSVWGSLLVACSCLDQACMTREHSCRPLTAPTMKCPPHVTRHLMAAYHIGRTATCGCHHPLPYFPPPTYIPIISPLYLTAPHLPPYNVNPSLCPCTAVAGNPVATKKRKAPEGTIAEQYQMLVRAAGSAHMSSTHCLPEYCSLIVRCILAIRTAPHRRGSALCLRPYAIQ